MLSRTVIDRAIHPMAVDNEYNTVVPVAVVSKEKGLKSDDSVFLDEPGTSTTDDSTYQTIGKMPPSPPPRYSMVEDINN